MRRFENRVVLVTGAGSGIGEASALRMGSEGGKIACVDIDGNAAEATAKAVREAGGEANAWVCDISDQATVQKTVHEVAEHYGQLNALCNIAGILHADHTLELSMDVFDRVLAVNLRGTFMMCQTALPYLIETKGSIVNMASTAALGAHAWMAAYSASKGGILALTKALAVEFGRKGVNSNAICPASVETPMSKSVRLPEGFDPALLRKVLPFDDINRPPSDVASAVAFLASEDAVHINGDHIRTDGGVMT
ncbi:MAG: SDR family oxidoreductase [bacterium]|nr:SDR family oxidoreductase [bacterium]